MPQEKYLFKIENYEQGNSQYTMYGYGKANEAVRTNLSKLKLENMDIAHNLKKLAEIIKEKYSNDVMSNLTEERLLIGPFKLSSEVRSPLNKKELKTLAELVSKLE